MEYSMCLILLIIATLILFPADARNAAFWPKNSSIESYKSANCVWKNVTETTTLNFFHRAGACFEKLYIKNSQHDQGSKLKSFHPHLACNSNTSSLLPWDRMISLAESEFANKTISFIGDSTLHHDYFAFVCMIANGTNVLLNKTSHGFTINTGLNTTIHNYKYGKHFGTLGHFRQTLQYALNKTASHVDYLVVNQGLHHEHNNENHTHDYMNTLRGIAEFTVDAYAKSTPSNRPKAIWREITPQNHPSSNGWWTPQCHWTCRCVVLNATQIAGSVHFDPKSKIIGDMSIVPNNARNIVLEDLFVTENNDSRSLPLAATYQPLIEAPFLIHGSNVDCTHMGFEASMFTNQVWMSYFFD